MAKRISIRAGKVEASALLNEGPTAGKLWEALPLEGSASRWGDEVYFAIELEASPEAGAREEMEVGEIAYWPPGRAFCIFFGPTPASGGEAPRAASPVNPLGKVEGDATLFRKVREGTRVVLSRAD